MARLVERASKLVVMSEFGRGTLIDIYGADAEQIEVIEHGTPERPFAARSPLRDTLGVGDRPILSTFGLIGPGKGLEAAIRALPAITAQYPAILNRSDEHTSERQSLLRLSYPVFRLKKNQNRKQNSHNSRHSC